MVWFAVGILVVVAASVIVVSVASRRAESQLSAVRQEMQNSLATQGQTAAAQISQLFSQQMGNLMQTLTQQLGQVRQELQSGVATLGSSLPLRRSRKWRSSCARPWTRCCR